jgi:hypothetical protein
MFSRRLAPHTDMPRTNSRNLGDRDHFRVRAMKVLFLLGLVACASWVGALVHLPPDCTPQPHTATLIISPLLTPSISSKVVLNMLGPGGLFLL